MTVAEFRKFVTGLTAPLAVAGATAKVLGELDRLAASLEPFDSLDFGKFAAFVADVQTWKSSGEIPPAILAVHKMAAKPRRAPAAPKPPKPAKLSVEEATGRLQRLYDSAPQADVRLEDVDRELTVVLAGLSVVQLKQVAKALEISRSLANRAAAVAEITRKIRGRKEMAIIVPPNPPADTSSAPS